MQKLTKFLAEVLSTCLWIGFVPGAPGTWASIAAAFFWVGLQTVGVHLSTYFLILGSLFLLGVWASSVYSRYSKNEDPSEVVVDEWVGMGIALAFARLAWIDIILALILFRIFDIGKPLGVRYFDRKSWGGWSVMLDDVVAGIYAMICLGVVQWVQVKVSL